MKRSILAVLLLAVAVSASDTPKVKNAYKVTHLSVRDAIVTCENGVKPTVKSLMQDSIVISCGE